MSGKIARLVVQAFKKPVPARTHSEQASEDTELTSREQEVLHHLLDGQLYKEIAQTMGVSAHTVNFHIQNIYKKLHCRSRAQLVAKFMQK